MSEQTLRQQIFALLSEQAIDARALSAALGIREKEVLAHLVHVERTATAGNRRFIVHPSRCLACGFAFEKRRRLSCPGRCPLCRSQRISQPLFQIS